MDRNDPIAGFAAARSLGTLEQRLELHGAVTLETGRLAPAELCLAHEGAWLIAASDAEHGVAVDLGPASDVVVVPGRVRDRLRVAGRELSVPSGKSPKALEILGLGRVRRGLGAGAGIWALRHVEPLGAVVRQWLERHLDSGEALLAWLRGSDEVPVESSILGTRPWPVHLLLTERRTELVALSPVGDARVTPFATAPLRIERRRRSIVMHVRELAWSAKDNAELYREIADIAGLPPGERLRETARLNFIHRDRAHGPFTAARHLLDAAVALSDADAVVAATLMALEFDRTAPPAERLESILKDLPRSNAPRRALAELWQRWQFSASAGLEFAHRLRGRTGAEPWAVELHDSAHAALDPAEDSATAADIDLAKHWLDAQVPARATLLLERRLEALPRRGIEDLLPPVDRDPTRPSASDESTILELLSRSKAPGGGWDPDALAALARLEPLVPERVGRLAAHATGNIAERAWDLCRMFEGIDPSSPPLPKMPGPYRPLDALDVTRFVKHPLARDDTLVGRLQALLALVPSPDPALLRDYCERLSEERHPEASHAVEEAARTLGVAGVQAYVSRGDKAIGVRSYEDTPPFVLIGGRHLEPGDPFHMTALELEFAFGAEIAHLRFGHNRVTPEEVWTGALSRTSESVNVLLGVLPALKGWRIADKASHIAERMPRDTLKRVIEKIRDSSLRRAAQRTDHHADNAGVLTRLNEELVAAHRLMQLSADRAGLILAGDLRACVRAMLLVRADHPEQLEALDRRGVAALVRELDTAGQIAHQSLAVRLSALFSFYLSDDYARLRSLMVG